QVEPACARGDEDVVQARMRLHPGPRLQAVVTGQVIGDQIEVPPGMVRFDSGQERDVLFGVARGRTPRQLLAVADPQPAIDPGLLWPPLVVQGGGSRGGHPPTSLALAERYAARPAPIRRYTGSSSPQGDETLVGDDRGPFGAKSLSCGSPQLWVPRQRTPSR